jgi:hypothetical protein
VVPTNDLLHDVSRLLVNSADQNFLGLKRLPNTIILHRCVPFFTLLLELSLFHFDVQIFLLQVGEQVRVSVSVSQDFLLEFDG